MSFRRWLVVCSFYTVFLLSPSISFAHGGGLDSSCGHHDRKKGGYHYHTGNCTPSSSSSSSSSSPSKNSSSNYTPTPYKSYKSPKYKTYNKASSKPRKSGWYNVTSVLDGDTLSVSSADARTFFKCRLYGIDAPEKSQPYGKEALRVLQGLLQGSSVNINLTGDKSYGKEICIITSNGVNINKRMIELGYSWAYKDDLDGAYASEYIDAENEARELRLGIWKQSNPTPPWEFRKMKR